MTTLEQGTLIGGNGTYNNGKWLTRRERKRRMSNNETEGVVTDIDAAGNEVRTDEDEKSAPSSTELSASLLPYLGWTKLSSSESCRRRRIQKRQQELNRARRVASFSDNLTAEEAYQQVSGHAIFFIHDPSLDNAGEKYEDGDDKEENNNDGNDENKKLWFQGRFFPSDGSKNIIMDSWGILAETGDKVVDDCLNCPDGGFRILDVTFLRRCPITEEDDGRPPPTPHRRRWTARDILWTGGNMMTLTSENYSLPLISSSSLKKIIKDDKYDEQTSFLKFDPCKLVEGRGAVELASKYFPMMLRRVRARDVIENGFDRGEILNNVLVIIGSMQVSAPASFAMA